MSDYDGDALNDDQLLRYSRQLLLQEFDLDGQQALAGATVLLVGCGGLANPAALYLAGAGVGRLPLVDDPDTLVIDTRNSYETAIGSFEGAIEPSTESFRDFPQWAESTLRPMIEEKGSKRIAMFCTGGIRCEKASSYLQQQGFGEVHHLRGGILKYLEQVPEAESRWQGECFVFDQRVALNHRLEPGEHSLCHACGLPVSAQQRELPSYIKGVQCVHCVDRFSDADRERFAMRQRQIDQSQIDQRQIDQHNIDQQQA